MSIRAPARTGGQTSGKILTLPCSGSPPYRRGETLPSVWWGESRARLAARTAPTEPLAAVAAAVITGCWALRMSALPVTCVTGEKPQSSVFLQLDLDLISKDRITPFFPVLFPLPGYFFLCSLPLGVILPTPECPLPSGFPTQSPPALTALGLMGTGPHAQTWVWTPERPEVLRSGSHGKMPSRARTGLQPGPLKTRSLGRPGGSIG